MVNSESTGYKVTVVTAALNAASTIRGTLDSVAIQDYPKIEHIVVDGGSTDGTLNEIASVAKYLDHVITGPDSGIADAMNKGVQLATGDLVVFLHADDRFVDKGALRRAVAHIDDLDAIWAFDILFGEGDASVRCAPRPFNPWVRFKNPLPHQGVLCPRRWFRELGGFDESFLIDMDYEFWLRAYLAGVTLCRVPEALAVMGEGGISSQRDWNGLNARFEEERRVHTKHAQGLLWRSIYAAYWPLYLIYRRMVLSLRRK